jgi:hypothetical protein
MTESNVIGSLPPLDPPETKIVNGVEIQMVRLPFLYYNTDGVSKFYHGEKKLVCGEKDLEGVDVYCTREYETPKKGFKLHPALRQELKPGEKHKPVYYRPWRGTIIDLKNLQKEEPTVGIITAVDDDDFWIEPINQLLTEPEILESQNDGK